MLAGYLLVIVCHIMSYMRVMWLLELKVNWMTSKKTIAERSLTTIQLSKETVQRLRQAESYPRETHDCIIDRLLKLNTAMAAKLKGLEVYPHEPIESILTRLVEEHNNRIPKGEQVQTVERTNKSNNKVDAAEVFQKEFAKITGQ